MKVLFVSLYSFNKLSDGYIAADLVSQFIKEGHTVTVVAPKEGADGIALDESEGFKNVKIGCGQVSKTSAVKKVINLYKLDLRARKFLKKENSKFDLVVCMISHCAFYRTVKFIKRRDNAFVYNMVKDIFPQNAVDMGMMKKGGLLYKWFKYKEDKYYAISDVLGVLSDKTVEVMKQLSPKIAGKKIEVNPNSCIVKNIGKSKEQRTAVFKKHEIPIDKTVFIYGGNLGKPQGVEFLLECLKHNEKRDGKAYFVIAGNGTEYEKIAEYFASENVINSKLMARLDAQEFQELCLAADAGLVFLNKDFTVPNYPSRILSYMQAHLPILFAVDKACDAGEIAEKNKYGFNCLSGELEKFFEFVKVLESDKSAREKMGESAHEFMAKNYTVKQSYDIIMENFK